MEISCGGGGKDLKFGEDKRYLAKFRGVKGCIGNFTLMSLRNNEPYRLRIHKR